MWDAVGMINITYSLDKRAKSLLNATEMGTNALLVAGFTLKSTVNNIEPECWQPEIAFGPQQGIANHNLKNREKGSKKKLLCFKGIYTRNLCNIRCNSLTYLSLKPQIILVNSALIAGHLIEFINRSF